MEITTTSTEQTKKVAERVTDKLANKPGVHVIALYGDLGSGKTTFVKYLVAALGIKARVQSPTFVVHRRYESKNARPFSVINHVDLYRVGSKDELPSTGVEEFLQNKDELTIIEWPEVAEGLFDGSEIKVRFTDLGGSDRKIVVEGFD